VVNLRVNFIIEDAFLFIEVGFAGDVRDWHFRSTG